jgi:hypothetical protein
MTFRFFVACFQSIAFARAEGQHYMPNSLKERLLRMPQDSNIITGK